MAAIRLNGYEREVPSSLVAARLMYLFDTQREARHAVAYLSPQGKVMVRPLPQSKVHDKRPVIGTYTRDVTLQQILDDVEQLERDGHR